MEEKNKYFTPEIEDIRVGYKCEIENNNKWTSLIINGFDNEENSINSVKLIKYYCNNDIKPFYFKNRKVTEFNGFSPRRKYWRKSNKN
jgi:hypothetical protein